MAFTLGGIQVAIREAVSATRFKSCEDFGIYVPLMIVRNSNKIEMMSIDPKHTVKQSFAAVQKYGCLGSLPQFAAVWTDVGFADKAAV